VLVGPPPPGYARVRFVAQQGAQTRTWADYVGAIVSAAIRLDSRGGVSHVEAVLPDGTIVAALRPTGVTRCAPDYDTTSNIQIVVDIKMTPLQLATWESFLISRIGWPYDTPALAGFLFLQNFHREHALICSALITDALRHCGRYPALLAQAYHDIDPVVALLMLQAQPEGSVIIHPVEYLEG